MIGVVGDVLHEGLDGEPKPEMYVPVEQAPNTESGPTIVLRTALDAGAGAAELRGAVSAIDRTMPVDRIETMEQLAQLRMLDCDLGQGYLIARPMPKEQFLTLLQNRAEKQRREQAEAPPADRCLAV